ncbi:nuclease-related domain-containing protein [Virgibacillus halodenitrificans]|uniref:nuclease-related domain-containing protein n=1 Tax=Virgibacillus halodenitrificans TaxID=1482 RepID=UPI0024BF239C|nr:nuclease-related domain-containing protein [Virgibacillus halodenitrificans]WHX26031.1 nuclease-related domain-containing protein [Virgibacillus halodenitrificans]
MHVNKRLKPYSVLCYEALFRQLKPQHRNNSTINQDYLFHLAGYRGEQLVDYQLSTHPLRHFHIYKGLRLKVNNNPFQIDTLLTSTKFFLNIEVKNMKGILNYNSELDQLTQTYNNSEKGYQSPVLQTFSHEMQLNFWLQQVTSFHGIPIESLVVIADPATIVKNPKNDPTFNEKVIYANKLIPKINELKAKYTNNRINKTGLRQIHEAILRCDTPKKPNLIKYYKLNNSHFLSGIECSNCHHSPLKRGRKKWYCCKCNLSDQTAHARKILDYFLLFNSTITNKECKLLLQTESDKTAYTALKSMELFETGSNRGRKYHAPPLEKYPQHSYVPNKERKPTLTQ